MADKKLSQRLIEACSETEIVFLEEAERLRELANSGRYTPADTERFRELERSYRRFARDASDTRLLADYLKAKNL